jgi:hypothetical protein
MWAVSHTGRKLVPWRKSARASSLCQEAVAAAMAEFAGSVQLASYTKSSALKRVGVSANSSSRDLFPDHSQIVEQFARAPFPHTGFRVSVRRQMTRFGLLGRRAELENGSR